MNDEDSPEPSREAVIEVAVLARRGLQAAVSGDVTELGKTIAAITKAHGAWGNYQMVVFWVQDTVEYMGIGGQGPKPVAYYSPQTGCVEFNTDHMTREGAWAMRVINTYASGAHDLFRDLLYAVPKRQFVGHVAVLIDTLVNNIKAKSAGLLDDDVIVHLHEAHGEGGTPQ